MPQHDMIIDNGSGASVRGDINAALAALASTNKGPNAPPSPSAGMMWLDDDTPSTSIWTWKVYDGADWLTVGTINISTNSFTPAVGGPLLAAAGSAAAPAYSFAGEPDTGIFNDASNSVAISTNGRKAAQFNDSEAYFFGNPSLSATILYLLNLASSATVQRSLDINGANENSVPITLIRSLINTDGSGDIQFWATPPGSRASDRRANRLNIPGSGPVVIPSGGLDVSNDLRFNSGYGSAGLAFGCRAWVNFDGSGTPAIRGSGNVSSITDNGVADYTVNLASAMPDANGSVTVGSYSLIQSNSQAYAHMLVSSVSASSFRLVGGGSSGDPTIVCAALHR